MTKVQTTQLSADSALHHLKRPGDFMDCYTVACTTTPREAAERIATFPAWVECLMQLRGVLVAPFGLMNEGPETGDRIGPFPVTSETEEELIAGFDDKHLDFRLAIRAEAGQVSLATWVHPHNWGGRAYLAAIMPFHILIARNALSRLAQS